MATQVYNSYKKLQQSGTIDLLQDNIKVLLVSGSYTPNIDTHTVTGDIGANQVVGAGYSLGGVLLSGKTLTISTSNDSSTFDASDVVWSSSTITASGAIVYASGASASTSHLISFFDFGSNLTSTNGLFTITWSSEGILRNS